MADQSGKNNPNWKGGRVVEPRGYILVRVGKNHPLADIRGYAYEHRLNAEKDISRPLLPGEEVHHDDEDKGNNKPSNLIVASSKAEHAVFHRKRIDLRLPNEDNPSIRCACGCKEQLQKFDADNRPRTYISGHNPQPSPTLDAIIGSLKAGPKPLRSIAPNLPLRSIKVALSKLKKNGLVRNIRHGIWELKVNG